jgi:hypothetical protein
MLRIQRNQDLKRLEKEPLYVNTKLKRKERKEEGLGNLSKA